MVNEIVDYFVERSGIAKISIRVNIVINIFYFIEIKKGSIYIKQSVNILKKINHIMLLLYDLFIFFMYVYCKCPNKYSRK
jgi:hypothetical protein